MNVDNSSNWIFTGCANLPLKSLILKKLHFLPTWQSDFYFYFFFIFWRNFSCLDARSGSMKMWVKFLFPPPPIWVRDGQRCLQNTYGVPVMWNTELDLKEKITCIVRQVDILYLYLWRNIHVTFLSEKFQSVFCWYRWTIWFEKWTEDIQEILA